MKAYKSLAVAEKNKRNGEIMLKIDGYYMNVNDSSLTEIAVLRNGYYDGHINLGHFKGNHNRCTLEQ